MTVEPARRLRVDAARNHERIVTAAAAAFEQEGAAVSLEEIARRAGVGVATLYRRFHTRDELVRAVIRHVADTEMTPATTADTGDPWQDLAGALGAVVESVSAHRILVAAAREAGVLEVDAVHRHLDRLDGLLGRAKRAGVVRPELVTRDLAAVLIMAIATLRLPETSTAHRRRYLALLLVGLRPAAEPLPPVD